MHQIFAGSISHVFYLTVYDIKQMKAGMVYFFNSFPAKFTPQPQSPCSRF
jgi:hypothetical protein